MAKASPTAPTGGSAAAEILLIEDHHEAYYAWRERSFRGMTLVHLDAHIDFWFQEVKPAPLIVHEAQTIAELKAQLAKASLFRRKRFDLEKLTDIGNYIYPAMRDGIVDTFYWVIPGKGGELKKCLGFVKKLLRDLWKEDPYPPDAPMLIKPGMITTRLYGRPFYICLLETLPHLAPPVLLDIDTDFLIIDSLRTAVATMQIARRSPWIAPEDLIRRLQEKIPRPLRLTTIAYSVNGGFTPMLYKVWGDRLARALGCQNGNLSARLHAGEHFRRFRESFDRQDFSTAAKAYRAAIRLNAAYRVADNTYGPLYFQLGDYRRAAKEWQRMLQVDGEDVHALSGLGKIRLAGRKYGEARSYFTAALALQAGYQESLLGLARAEFHLQNYGAAAALVAAYELLEPMQDYSRYLAGRIEEKMGRPREALAKYKEALQLGMEHVDLLVRLVRLSKRYEKTNLTYLQKKCTEYRKSFRQRGKGIAGEKGEAAAKRTEARFRKLLASLRRPAQR